MLASAGAVQAQAALSPREPAPHRGADGSVLPARPAVTGHWGEGRRGNLRGVGDRRHRRGRRRHRHRRRVGGRCALPCLWRAAVAFPPFPLWHTPGGGLSRLGRAAGQGGGSARVMGSGDGLRRRDSPGATAASVRAAARPSDDHCRDGGTARVGSLVLRNGDECL